MPEIDYKQKLKETDFGDAQSIEQCGRLLEDMTFREVLKIGIVPDDGKKNKDYSNPNYKGGMGNLIEERFFGYRANSSPEADFPEAGVELKATCYDVLKNGSESAGERLVLTMIPYDQEITEDFYASHVWKKCAHILLIYYHRDKTINRLEQRIKDVRLFEIPLDDLDIIQGDYAKIVSYIQAGKADELSESLTNYLAANTKGKNAEKSTVLQFYPRTDPETGKTERHLARKRSFSLKRSYMNTVLHDYVLNKPHSDDRILSKSLDDKLSFEERIQTLVKKHVGKTDKELCKELDVEYPKDSDKRKGMWAMLAYRMLGVKTARAEEFVKANISLRCIRIEANGNIKESLSFAPFKFKELVNETWEESPFRIELEESRFFIVYFKADISGEYRLGGSKFWAMPVKDTEGEAKRCWEETKRIIQEGVRFKFKSHEDGSLWRIENNLPGSKTNAVAHVRPHTSKSAYLLNNGYSKGDIVKDANELPDGQFMTTQSFWLNRKYLKEQLGL